MKFTAIILLMGYLFGGISAHSQTVTLSVKNARLENVFDQIKKQTGYTFFYDASLLNKAFKVTINVKNMPVEQALDICFKNTDLTYSIVEGTIIVKKKEAVEIPPQKPAVKMPEGITVQGRVTNRAGEPLAGASIQVKGKDIGVNTDYYPAKWIYITWASKFQPLCRHR